MRIVVRMSVNVLQVCKSLTEKTKNKQKSFFFFFSRRRVVSPTRLWGPRETKFPSTPTQMASFPSTPRLTWMRFLPKARFVLCSENQSILACFAIRFLCVGQCVFVSSYWSIGHSTIWNDNLGSSFSFSLLFGEPIL